jgi:hypothetical protein
MDIIIQETETAFDKIKPILDNLFADKTNEDKFEAYEILADFIWIDYDIKMPDGYGKKPNDTI